MKTPLDDEAEKMYWDKVIRPQVKRETRLEFILPLLLCFVGAWLQKILQFSGWILVIWIFFWILWWPDNYKKILNLK